MLTFNVRKSTRIMDAGSADAGASTWGLF